MSYPTIQKTTPWFYEILTPFQSELSKWLKQIILVQNNVSRT